MGVTKDSVQIDISFLTDENRQYAKLIEGNKTLLKDLKAAQKEGKGLGKIINDIAKSGKAVAGINLDNLTKPQLVTRAKQLEQVLSLIPKTAPQYKVLAKELQGVNTQLVKIKKETRGVTDATNRLRLGAGPLGKVLSTAFGVFGGLGLASIGQGIVSIGKKIFTTTAQFEKFEAVLTNALGSQSEAQKAFQQIQDFAANTPFQVEEITESYIRLTNRGLQPTKEELIVLGDIAASQGKSFLQFTEAVLDATTNEFERLKEFGIKAKQAGDQVELSFKGQTVVVEKNQEAIKSAILEFGKLNGVQGSTASISQTIGGIWSNLIDNVTGLINALSDSGLGGALKNTIIFLNSAVSGLRSFVNANGSLEQSAAAATNAFNQQSASVAELEEGVNPLIERYEELNNKTDLSADEQEELKSVIQQIGNIVPTAITQFDEYGKTIDISTDKVRDFVDAQRLLLQQRNKEAIDENTKSLENYELELAKINKQLTTLDENGNIVKKIETVTLGGTFTKNISLSADEIKRLQANAAELENQLKTTGTAISLLSGTFDPGANKAPDPEEESITNPTLTASQIKKAAEKRKKAQEAAFKNQLATINNAADVEQLITDRALLNKEISESEHGKRLLEIERKQYENQLVLFDKFNKSKTVEAESAQNRIVEINQTFSRSTAPLAELGGQEIAPVERRGINVDLDRIESEEDQKLALLREKFVQGILLEQEYTELKLEAKQLALEQEIEILQQGTDAEILEASRKQEELTKVEEALTDERIKNAEREKNVKKSINDAVIDSTKEALDIGIDLLSKDEAARKKNAAFIKAFESGKVIAAGVKEVQDIWATSAQFGPIAGPILATVRTVLAGARTARAVGKIAATKFGRGGKVGTFGGKPHSQGGTRGVFDDGTVVEVERDEDFFVVNKRSSALRRSLSAFNQMGGGVPLMRDGGVVRFQNGGVADIDTNPSGISIPSAASGGTAPDLSPILEQFATLTTAIAEMPRTLKAKVVYDDYQEVESDINTVEAASSIS